MPIWKDFFGTPFEAASIFDGNFYEATMLWGLAENASNRGGLRPSNKSAKSVKQSRKESGGKDNLKPNPQLEDQVRAIDV